MSWEYRGNNRYYYRRRKVGGQIVWEYLGNGLAAEMAAEMDDTDRQQRQTAAAEWQAMVDDERQTVDQLAKVEDLVQTLTAGVMLANGFHTHRRQWRKMSDYDRKSDR